MESGSGSQFDDDYVRSESPIDVAPDDNPTSEPEPDLVVTFRSRRELRYEPKDVVLVVEVSDSTYDYDRTVKAALYAGAGIAEYLNSLHRNRRCNCRPQVWFAASGF